MKKIWIIIVLCTTLFLIAWSWRFNLNEYEEECFAYKQAIREEYFCNSNFRYANICFQEVTKAHSTDKTEIDCSCPKESIVKKNFTYTTRECIKYLLVRSVED